MDIIMKELQSIASESHTDRSIIDNEKKDIENFTNALQEEWNQGDAEPEDIINKLLDLLTDAKQVLDDASDMMYNHQLNVENIIDDIQYEQASQRAQAM